MAEADELCERIAIVDRGRILAIGTPGRAQAAGPARVDLPARARPARRRDRRAWPACPASSARAPPRPTRRTAHADRQTVAVNLVARRGRGARRRRQRAGRPGRAASSRSASPSRRLEDVFVELVGRGFDDDRRPTATTATTGRATTTPPTGRRPPATSRTARHEPAEEPNSCDAARVYVHRPDGEPAGRRQLDAAPGPADQPRGRIAGRAYPRVRGLAREKSWLFFEILLPFLTTSAFVFVYRALQAPQEYIGLRGPRRRDDRVLAERHVDDGRQLYWEKNQGNLELYFAAPMNVMAVLFGMAFGGLVMSSTRAVVVLVIATVLYGVTFAVDQWVLLLAVFFLTLAALYGLGMVLASLFLLWGREAWHLTQVLPGAGLLRVGPQLPGRPAGRARRARDRAASRSPSGSTRCASSPSPTPPTRGHAAARGRGAHPRRHDRRLPAASPAGCSGRSSGWPAAKGGCRSGGSERARPPLDAPHAAARFDPRRTRGRGVRDLWRSFRTAVPAGLADGGELDRPGPVLHLLGRQAGQRRR